MTGSVLNFVRAARVLPFVYTMAFVWFGGYGCATYTEETKEIRSAYIAGNYKTALEKIDDSVLKTQERNKLLFYLEKATILDRYNERPKSRNLFFDADKLADRLYTKSVSSEALTYVYNESIQEYAGEDYEKVAIHSMLALSFLRDDMLKEARIEAKKINTKLEEINNQYKDHKNRYGDDAFANYLAGLIYEARDEDDDALIDYGRALKIYETSYSKYFATPVPDGLVRALYRLAVKRNRGDLVKRLEKSFSAETQAEKKELSNRNTGELVVIHEYGVIAPKVAQEFVLPIAGQIIRVSYPVIKARDFRFGDTGFRVDGGKLVQGDLVENMDKIAKETLDDKRARLIVKQTARLVAKGVATDQAYRNFGIIGGLAANVYSAVTETADTRGWNLLPAAFFITRKSLAPGKYKIQMRNQDRLTEVVDVEIKPGKMVILRDVR